MQQAGRYLLRRLALLVPLLLAVTFGTFMLLRLGSTPAIVKLAGPTANPGMIAQVRAEYALDLPLPVQFAKWLFRAAQGDLGRSWLTNKPVADELFSRLPATLELLTYGTILGALAAVPLGVLAGFGRGWRDQVTRSTALFAESVPSYFLALVLVLVFYHWLNIAPPPSGRISVMITPPTTVTGSMFIDSILSQDSTATRSAFGQLVLPVLCIAIAVAAPVIGRVRAIVVAAFASDHVAHGRAQGLPPMVARLAMQGTASPVARTVGGEIATLIGVVAVVEYVFAWGGMGQFGLDAIAKGDFASVQGFVLLSTLFAVAVLFLMDLLRLAFEPREDGA